MSIDLNNERWDLLTEPKTQTELDFKTQDVVSLIEINSNSINLDDAFDQTDLRWNGFTYNREWMH